MRVLTNTMTSLAGFAIYSQVPRKSRKLQDFSREPRHASLRVIEGGKTN
jgi:hypothetical protein